MPVVSFKALPIRTKGSITEQVSPCHASNSRRARSTRYRPEPLTLSTGTPVVRALGSRSLPKVGRSLSFSIAPAAPARSCENIRLAPYGKVTLHQARIAAQKVFSAKLEGRDPAREKREARIREVTDRVADVLETYITQHVSANRSAAEISRLLRREVGGAWGHKSIHDISKRDVVELVSAIDQRGAPAAANKTLKSIKTFLGWCVGRAILDKSPAEGVPLPAREVARDRILSDVELAKVIRAARTMAGPYGSIVEFLALTGQRREEVAQSTWDEFDLKAALGRYPKHGRKTARRTLCISQLSYRHAHANAEVRRLRFHYSGNETVSSLLGSKA